MSRSGVPFPLGPRGPFVLLDVLGRGAMGAVYRALELQSQREVALKFVLGLDTQRQARLAREGELTASLNHPGILLVHGSGVLEGVPYLVYELVPDARTLDQAAEGADLFAKVALVRDAAAALGHAHQQGVVHRDVKPENVLVSGEGRVVVADFGLAAARDAERLTRTGALLGTPLYMAPEQLTGARETSPATDVWALGVVLFELLAGERPFAGGSILELIREVTSPQPPLPSSRAGKIPRTLDAICLRALSQEPELRHPTGTELADDLSAFLDGRAVSRETASALGLARMRRARTAGLAALVALVSAGLLAAVASNLRSPEARPVSASATAPTRPPSAGAVVGSKEWRAQATAAWERARRAPTLGEEADAVAAWLEAYTKHPLREEALARARALRGETPLGSVVHGRERTPTTAIFLDGGDVITWARHAGARRWKSDGKGLLTDPTWIVPRELDVRAADLRGGRLVLGIGKGTLALPLEGTRLSVRAELIESVGVSPDGGRVAIGYQRGGWEVRALPGGELLGARPADVSVFELSFSPKGERIALSKGNGEKGDMLTEGQAIQVWEATPLAQEPETWIRLPVIARAVVWFDDASLLVGTGIGGLFHFDRHGKELGAYRAPSRQGEVMRVSSAHLGGVRCAWISPTGKHVVSISQGDTPARSDLRLWDRRTRELLRRYDCSSAPLSLSGSPEGDVIALGSRDGSLTFWRLPPD